MVEFVRKQTIAGFEISEKDPETFSISGYALKWGVDAEGDLIPQGSIHPSPNGIVVFYGHNSRDFPMGKITKVYDTPEGLKFEGFLVNTTRGKEAKALVEHGILDKVSIGARIVDAIWEEDIFVLKKLELQEISLVHNPAREGTSVALKSKERRFLNEIAKHFHKLP